MQLPKRDVRQDQVSADGLGIYLKHRAQGIISLLQARIMKSIIILFRTRIHSENLSRSKELEAKSRKDSGFITIISKHIRTRATVMEQRLFNSDSVDLVYRRVTVL